METQPSHLLSTLGVLASFSIAKKINKTELDKISNSIKKKYKEKNPFKIQQLLEKALIENAKKHIIENIPPGLVFDKKSSKKIMLDKYYNELSILSQVVSSKFSELKLTKIQICFIINACVNILGITEENFEEFNKEFQKYKNEDFDEDN